MITNNLKSDTIPNVIKLDRAMKLDFPQLILIFHKRISEFCSLYLITVTSFWENISDEVTTVKMNNPPFS